MKHKPTHLGERIISSVDSLKTFSARHPEHKLTQQAVNSRKLQKKNVRNEIGYAQDEVWGYEGE